MAIFSNVKFFSIFNNLKIRLTLLYVFFFGITLIPFSVFIYKQIIEIQNQELNNELYNYIVEIDNNIDIDQDGDVDFRPVLQNVENKIFPFLLGKTKIAIINIEGKVFALAPNTKLKDLLGLKREHLRPVLKKEFITKSFEINGHKFRAGIYLMPTVFTKQPFFLEVIVPLTVLETIENQFIKTFYLTIVTILLLSTIVGYFFARSALQPMNDITNETRGIKAHDLKKRIMLPKYKDEIWRLASTINELLDRLEKTFIGQEQFIQNASHQLKTPLAIMQGELELFGRRKQSADELDRFLASLKEEIKNLTDLNNNLLILARVDSGQGSLDFQKVNIDDVVLTQVARLSKLAFEKEVILTVDMNSFYEIEEPLAVEGDIDLLNILFFNLIENAIKYTNNGSTVTIKGTLESGRIVFTVMDEGPGINSDELELIFERFYRGTTSQKGHGLGLAICQKIASIHHADLSVTNRSDGKSGAIFKIIL